MTVILATARSPRGARNACSELGLTGPQLTMNGAVFSSPASGRIHWVRSLRAREYQAHLAFARQLNLSPTVCLMDGYAVERPRAEAAPAILPSFTTPASVRTVDRLEDVFDKGPIRTFICTGPERHAAVVRAARAHFGPTATVAWADDEGLELMLPATSKGHGLRTVARAMGLARADVAAIGDGPNDLEMLAWAGRSAAMANAPRNVRAAADLVVPTSADDGVIPALQHFFPDLALSGSPLPDEAARTAA